MSNFVYILWGRDDESATAVAAELCISILSVKKTIPNSKIHLFLCDDNLNFMGKFFEQHIDVIHVGTKDNRTSLVSKFITLRYALEEIEHFYFLDSDTRVFKDFTQIKLPELGFASYLQTKLSYAPDYVYRFFKRYFGAKRIHRPKKNDSKFGRVHSGMIHVNQKNVEFWSGFKTQYDKVIDKFLDKIDENSTIKYDGHLFNDEYYFTVVLQQCGLSPQDFVVNKDIFNQHMSDYVEHKFAITIDKQLKKECCDILKSCDIDSSIMERHLAWKK